MIRTILVDDEEKYIDSHRSILEANGSFQIIASFTNSMTALDTIPSVKPDLCCFDVMMPYLDGVALSMELQKILPDIKIVLISSANLGFLPLKEMGILGIISKPFTSEKVQVLLDLL